MLTSLLEKNSDLDFSVHLLFDGMSEEGIALIERTVRAFGGGGIFRLTGSIHDC